MSNLLYSGKTKDVFDLGTGELQLIFKNTVTGHNDGTVDPGGNQVVGEQLGIAEATIAMSTHFYQLLQEAGIPTHYISSDIASKEMIVKEAHLIGDGVEFIKRYRATGSLIRRHPDRYRDGELVNITEFTLKDDANDDPLVTADELISDDLVTAEDLEQITDIFEKSCTIIHDELQRIGLELWDIKLEIGLCENTDGEYEWSIIDEVGPGIMRVYKDGAKLDKLELAKIVTGITI
ncbi:MAG: phosphoribosylaminoimidazolesuccinocarboxamide synthase [Candidatus Saccharimonadales bacterium]